MLYILSVREAGHIRVSDAEREGLVDELREHTVDGRLTSDEFEQRLDAVYAAKTRADLAVLRADLPVSTTAARRAQLERKARLRARILQEAGGAAVLSAVCVAIWFASAAHDHHGSFWPVWVIVFAFLPLVRDSWRLLGPGSDLDTVEARLQARHERRIARDARRGRRHLPPSL